MNPIINATFRDLQDPLNPNNGRSVCDAQSLKTIFDSLRGRPPFLCEFMGDEVRLVVGVGDSGFVQFGAADGEPPYLVAIGSTTGHSGDSAEFLTANTPTPIPRRYCMPMATVCDIVLDCLVRKQPSPQTNWEEI